MRRIKIAILGLGRSGRNIHGEGLLKIRDKYEIVVAADPIEGRCKRAEHEYGCDTCNDYRLLFGRQDIDIVINATPSHLHVPITLDLLQNGFNVLCEKPLARYANEVDVLATAARVNNKLLAVFQQSRYAPYFLQVRKVVDSGVLGRIIKIGIAFNGFARRWDWQCIQEYNGGNLLNTGPHPLDQALQFLGMDVTPGVRCIMDRANTAGDAEDYVKLLLTGPGKPLIDLEISSCSAYPCFTYEIHGTRGGLKGSMTHMDWKYFLSEEAPALTLVRTPLSKEDDTPSYCEECLKWHEYSWDVPSEQADLFSTMTNAFYNMLYKSYTEGLPLEISLEQVRRQIAVIEECHRQNHLSRMA
jgi:scyllo-inositol 2-dehydrogenase (NADP+)